MIETFKYNIALYLLRYRGGSLYLEDIYIYIDDEEEAIYLLFNKSIDRNTKQINKGFIFVCGIL